MITSMTGFGRAEAALPPAGRVAVEIRSVNHRFLEIETRLPEGFQAWEDEVRGLVARRLRRGQVRVAVSLQRNETLPPVEFDAGQARRYLKQLRKLEQSVGLRNAVTLEFLIGLPQVMVAANRTHPAGRQWPWVERAVDQALSQLLRMRQQEGARLQKALLTEIRTLGRFAGKVSRNVPEIQRQAQKRLAQRIETMLRGTRAPGASQAAVLAEAGMLVQASDISEELARLDSHLKALMRVTRGEPIGAEAAGKSSGPGRTIDFLAQELQREVNTLGTKLRDSGVIQCVVAMKGQIEKLREQAANLE